MNNDEYHLVYEGLSVINMDIGIDELRSILKGKQLMFTLQCKIFDKYAQKILHAHIPISRYLI